MPTIAHISDLHLQSGVPQRQAQVEPILRKINEMKPDLVVISGDVTDDGWDSEDELHWAMRWLLERVKSCDHFVVPGNHDVGNFIDSKIGTIAQNRVSTWNRIFGTRGFHELQSWYVLGINSMLLGANYDLEQAQLKWLNEAFNAADRYGYHIALFLHSPPFVSNITEEVSEETSYWLGPEQARQLLWNTIRNATLIGSGHVHQTKLQSISREHMSNTTIAWAPPASGTWVHAPGLPNPPMPEKTGFFLHTLHDDGRVESELIECAPMLKLYEHRP